MIRFSLSLPSLRATSAPQTFRPAVSVPGESDPSHWTLSALPGTLGIVPFLRQLAGSRRRYFQQQDYTDLQVLSQIAWFDEFFLDEPEIASLIKKGRSYSSDDQRYVMSRQRELLAKVLPRTPRRPNTAQSASPHRLFTIQFCRSCATQTRELNLRRACRCLKIATSIPRMPLSN